MNAIARAAATAGNRTLPVAAVITSVRRKTGWARARAAAAVTSREHRVYRYAVSRYGAEPFQVPGAVDYAGPQRGGAQGSGGGQNEAGHPPGSPPALADRSRDGESG